MTRYNLAPPDVIWLVRDYLRDQLAARFDHPAPVNDALADLDGEQVVLIPAGGQTRTPVSSDVRVVVDVYARTNTAAHRLASRVYALVADLDCMVLGGAQIYEVDMMPPYEYPHPDKPDHHRWQATYTIHVRHQPV